MKKSTQVRGSNMYKVNALIDMKEIEQVRLLDPSMVVLDELCHRVAVSFKVMFDGSMTELLRLLNRMYNNFKHYVVSTV